MGERKGQNKYYPPDFDSKKHFSLNSYHGVHALRERGKKAHEGILIIRFEMPFNCWCLTCNNPIGMGVRYNSEKTKVGYFYSTPIYQFKMNCHLCAGEIIIQTDPEHFQYLIISGARRREQRYEPEDVELPELADSKTRQKLATDAMFQLEHVTKDEQETKIVKSSLKKILHANSVLQDDYSLNQIARKKFRDEKKLNAEKQSQLDRISEKLSLKGGDITLLPMSEQDRDAAKFHLRNSGIDSSKKAVSKRKAMLIKMFKAKLMKKPRSRFIAFSKGIDNKSLSSDKQSISPNKVSSMLNATNTTEQHSVSLVSEEYHSTDDDGVS